MVQTVIGGKTARDRETERERERECTKESDRQTNIREREIAGGGIMEKVCANRKKNSLLEYFPWDHFTFFLPIVRNSSAGFCWRHDDL